MAGLAAALAGCGGGREHAPTTNRAGPSTSLAGPAARAGAASTGRPGSATPTPGPGGTRPAPGRTAADPRVVAARSHVPVLTYHQVRDWRPADSRSARVLITPPSAFAAQMDALAHAGFTTITGDQLVGHLTAGTPLPRKPVLITFDDASEGQYANALPILRRHRFVATFFVMTVVLDKPNWLSRAQVRALDRMGMTIASHTWDHHNVPGYRGRDWQVQLVDPARELASIVGHPVRLFAYPYGNWTRAAFPHLKQAGYVAAFQLAARMDPTGPLWTIRRIIVVPTWSTMAFLHAVAADF